MVVIISLVGLIIITESGILELDYNLTKFYIFPSLQILCITVSIFLGFLEALSKFNLKIEKIAYKIKINLFYLD